MNKCRLHKSSGLVPITASALLNSIRAWKALAFLTGCLFGLIEFYAAGAGGEAAYTAGDPAQPYRDFLSTPPWIRKIVYRRDRNYTTDITDRRHPRREEGLATHEAALQPNGWYRKSLEGSFAYDNPPGTKPRTRPVIPGQEDIAGASDRSFWRLSAGHDAIAVVPRDNQAGASTNNWLWGAFRMEMFDLERVRKLGLDKLADANVSWIDKDHFVADSAQYGTAHGTIDTYSNGLPSVVQYSIGAPNSFHFVVRYAYEPDAAFPPHQILVEETVKDGGVIIHTNYIDKLELGLDPKAEQGYFPEQFRQRSEPFKMVRVSSNGVLYHVDMRGRWHAEDTRYVPLKQSGSKAELTAIVFGVSVSALFLYFARRRALANKAKKTN